MRMLLLNSTIALAITVPMHKALANGPYDPLFDPPASSTPAIISHKNEIGHDWTGRYIGIYAGYARADSAWTFMNTATLNNDHSGVVVGAFGGFNRQLDNAVIGVETNSLAPLIEQTNDCLMSGIKCTTKLHWLGALRLRAGLPLNRVMPYLSAGPAIGVVGTRGDAKSLGYTGEPFTEVHYGFVAGGGVEVALGNSLTLRTDMTYFNLLERKHTRDSDSDYFHKVKMAGWMIDGGLALKF